MTAPPLSSLLSQVVVALTVEVDNEFEHRFLEAGGGARVASLTMWSNLLRFVGEGTTVDELVAVVGLPRAVVLSRVGGVERWRYVSAGSSEDKRDGYGSARGLGGDTVVRLTQVGHRAVAIWPVLPREIEARWRGRFGPVEITELVGVLREIDDRAGAELPDYLPVVGSANGLRLELGDAGGRRRDDDSLVGLAARALMTYTLAFERDAPVSLPLSANVLRVLDENAVPVRDLPARSGISKEAIAVSLTALAETGLVVVEGAPASKRTIRLTPSGAKARTGQAALHRRIERAWTDRYGAAAVASLRAGLARVLDHPALADGLAPHPECWRASKPYARQTERLLADPRAALPHHPMVLHRGGWPDGS